MSYILVVAAFVCFVVILSVVYPDRYLGTRPRKDLPGPKGAPILGNLFQIIPNVRRMTYWIDGMDTLYGALYTFTMPSWGRCIVVNHPTWLAHIRKKDTTSYTKGGATLEIFGEFPGPTSPFSVDGAAWRSRRKLIMPIFSVKTFSEQVSRAMDEIIPIAINMLQSAADDGIQFDWNNFSGRLAVSVLYRLVFGLDPESITSSHTCLNEPDLLVAAMHECNTTSSGRLYNPMWKVTERFTGKKRRFENARKELWRSADSVLSKRRIQIAAEKSAGEANSANDDFLTSMIDNGFTDSEIRGTIVTLFFAGHDNFLNVLGWSLYELSRAPEWFDRMREEAFRNNPPGGIPQYADVSKYHIHLAVFYETLRLWPGVPKNARFAEEDDILPPINELGLGEVKVNRGDYVLWSDRCMMRSESVWGTDSRVFNPGRFLDAQNHFCKPPTPKFHAFGAGPRLCPGAQLATYEFIAAWGALLPNIRISLLDKEERTMEDSFTSTMRGNMMVKVERLGE